MSNVTTRGERPAEGESGFDDKPDKGREGEPAASAEEEDSDVPTHAGAEGAEAAEAANGTEAAVAPKIVSAIRPSSI